MDQDFLDNSMFSFNYSSTTPFDDVIFLNLKKGGSENSSVPGGFMHIQAHVEVNVIKGGLSRLSKFDISCRPCKRSTAFYI